jgi:hypothetical protein
MFRQRFVLSLAVAFVVTIAAEWYWNYLRGRVYAQAEQTVECGDIVESEFTNENQEHKYALKMAPRESFNASLEPVGDYLFTSMFLYGPTGMELARSDNNGYSHTKAPSASSGNLSATGLYKIHVKNKGIGLYTLYVGCVTVNGEVKPGDIPQPTPTPAPLPTPTPRSAIPDSAPQFAGIGFPGLAPVDFSSVAEIPLLLDTVMTGVIPTSNEILGFTLDAAAGDTLDLSYTRVSGNMNLGLVVLSASNEVFFQASLVTSEALSTRFTLPVAGQYTIGVFRISLVEPDEVEPTVFQLKGNTTTD